MKKRSLGLVLLVALIGITLSGCGCFQQQMKGETPPPSAPQAVVMAPETKPEVPVAPPPPPPPAIAPAPQIVMKDINFDFDKYNIRERDAAILKENVAWFQTGKKARIEGHCDERGTVEYNLALGQRRADSAKAFLVDLGVNGNAFETVSYGKERPLDPGHNEAAWAANRRAHFEPIQ
jgi:peptidoglycan-associated lipoprotein